VQIDERNVGSVTVLDVTGQITSSEGGTLLKDKIHSLVHQGRKAIAVNLAKVTYIDSAGLGQLVASYTTVTQAGGQLKLVSLTKRIHDLLTITKLTTIFESFDSEQDAVKSFG